MHLPIKSHWNYVFLQRFKKYWEFTQFPVHKILRKWTVSADPRVIRPAIYGNCLLMENLHTRKSEEVTALYAVEANFPIIYFCLLLYVSYDSLKILLSFRIEKATQFWKFDNHMSSIDPRYLFAVIWVAEYVPYRHLIVLYALVAL